MYKTVWKFQHFHFQTEPGNSDTADLPISGMPWTPARTGMRSSCGITTEARAAASRWVGALTARVFFFWAVGPASQDEQKVTCPFSHAARYAVQTGESQQK